MLYHSTLGHISSGISSYHFNTHAQTTSNHSLFFLSCLHLCALASDDICLHCLRLHCFIQFCWFSIISRDAFFFVFLFLPLLEIICAHKFLCCIVLTEALTVFFHVLDYRSYWIVIYTGAGITFHSSYMAKEVLYKCAQYTDYEASECLDNYGCVKMCVWKNFQVAF